MLLFLNFWFTYLWVWYTGIVFAKKMNMYSTPENNFVFLFLCWSGTNDRVFCFKIVIYLYELVTYSYVAQFKRYKK